MNINNGTYTINKDGNKTDVQFNYRTELTASEKFSFVSNVMSLIVNDNMYASVIADMIFDFVLINTFTDIDTTSITESPNNIDRIEEFLNETNIVDIILENVDEDLIDTLRKCVDDNIEYKTGIRKNTFSNSIASLFKTFENQIGNIDTSKFMSMADKISSISGSITPEKLLDAYANTDIFKVNNDERIKEQAKRIN